MHCIPDRQPEALRTYILSNTLGADDAQRPAPACRSRLPNCLATPASAMQRRFGKSTALGQHEGYLLPSLPAVFVAIFSVSIRLSSGCQHWEQGPQIMSE